MPLTGRVSHSHGQPRIPNCRFHAGPTCKRALWHFEVGSHARTQTPPEWIRSILLSFLVSINNPVQLPLVHFCGVVCLLQICVLSSHTVSLPFSLVIPKCHKIGYAQRLWIISFSWYSLLCVCLLQPKSVVLNYFSQSWAASFKIDRQTGDLISLLSFFKLE